MSSPLGKDFEEQLAEAGKKLLDPPSSVEDLLPLLDKAEYYLSQVEQSPSKSIESALSPCMKALVADKLFKHTNVDINVAVASCISEITRISAPEAPYNDDLMKEAFQLIVSSFEHLDDKSSRSYEKRTSILATVAKVRSCVVMLDLECDALILQMFQYFLKAIRDYHPEHVYTSMETVMTLVIEESEDVSPDLLSPILATVKKDSEGILPIARKLGEKVLEKSAPKLSAALPQALNSLGTRVDDYSEVVSLICQDNNAANNRTDANAAGEHEVDNEATSPKSEVSSGVKQTAEDDPSTDSISVKKHGDAEQKTQMESTGVSSNDKPGKSDNGKEVKTARKPKKITRKRGRKPSTVKKSTKSGDSAHTDGEKEAEQSLDEDKDGKTDLPCSPRTDPSAEADVPIDGEKVADVAPPSPKEEQNESMDGSSPSKSAEPKKTEGTTKESEGPTDSEGEGHSKGEERSEDEGSDEDRTPVPEKTSKKGNEAADDAETNSDKQPSLKAHTSTVDKDGTTSAKSNKLKKGPVKGKVGRPKEKTSSSKSDAQKESVSSLKSGRKRLRDEDQSDETPKNKVKGKRTPVKEVGSNAKSYGKELVGSKVKVWWPDDKAFYKGRVKSYDVVKKEHTVLYDDGDIEKLKLKDERWELIQDDSSSSEDEAAEEETRESSPDLPPRKTPGRTPKGKAAKSGGKLKGSSGGSVKGKSGLSKQKAKQSDDVDGDSGEESDESNRSGKGKGVESSKSSGPGKRMGGSKTPGSKTPAKGTKTGGSKTAGSGLKTESKSGKKRRRGT